MKSYETIIELFNAGDTLTILYWLSYYKATSNAYQMMTKTSLLVTQQQPKKTWLCRSILEPKWWIAKHFQHEHPYDMLSKNNMECFFFVFGWIFFGIDEFFFGILFF